MYLKCKYYFINWIYEAETEHIEGLFFVFYI